MTKVVLDTNLLVAGFFNKNSASAKIIDLIKKGEVINLWTERIKKEADHILSKIPPIKEKYQKKIKKIVFKPENKIKNPPKLNIIKEDPEDNKLLACAVCGKADYLISNDEHLLEHDGYKDIKVITSSDFAKTQGLDYPK